MEETMDRQNDKLKIALAQINAACAEDISGETLIACVKGDCDDAKWRAHLVSFLEELPVALIHDLVLSGAFTFQELSDAIVAWGGRDGETTRWIDEMATLSMETAG
jgi:hypothetical protein